MLSDLFISFLEVGFFSIGGGMVSITLLYEELVVQRGWLTASAFTDLIAIAESTPGPIALNAATFIGMQLGGLIGALIATMGAIMPGTLIVLLLNRLYQRYRSIALVQGVMDGLRPVINAAIFIGGVTIARSALFIGAQLSLSSVDWLSVSLFIAVLLLLRKVRVTPAVLIIGSGLVGGAVRLLLGM